MGLVLLKVSIKSFLVKVLNCHKVNLWELLMSFVHLEKKLNHHKKVSRESIYINEKINKMYYIYQVVTKYHSLLSLKNA